METAKWRHKILSLVILVLAVAVSLHVAARLIVTVLPTLVIVTLVGLVVWTVTVIIRRRRERW